MIIAYVLPICMQVTRKYSGNALITFFSFALLSAFELLYFYTLKVDYASGTKVLIGEEEEENFLVAYYTMFGIPIKLFRIVQLVQSPSYFFWPFIVLSQLLDKGLPRFWALRDFEKSRPKVSKVYPDRSDIDTTTSSKDDDQSALRISGNVSVNLVDTTDVNTRALKVSNDDTLDVQIYETLRRDICTADYASVLVSLGLVLASPRDFLSKPSIITEVNSVFYSTSNESEWIRVMGFRASDVVAYRYEPWVTTLAFACISIVYSGTVEAVISYWESSRVKGLPFLTYTHKLRLKLGAALFLSSALSWMTAGSRDLFAFGPLT
ncbi:hypothetical protein BC829DRAFT_99687 [Chytridium lagenaria]|nr:hypothetical protein BC829DRAFT_99687 [Chytridium lagenaria]